MAKKRGNRRRKAILVIAAAFIVAGGVFATILVTRSRSQIAPIWENVTASMTIDSKTVEAAGNVEAVRSSALSFASMGLVAKVYVKDGQQVREGQALASLDDADQRYRYEDSRLRLEQYRLTGNARQAALGELELATRRLELDRARIDAPYSGFLSSVDISPGEYVSSGKIAMTIVDRSSLVAKLQIDEVDLPIIKDGQRVEFEFDALPGRKFDGYISRIPPVGRLTGQGLAVFDVTATIPKPPAELLPGYSFTAQVIITEPRNIVTIPGAALIDLPPPDQASIGLSTADQAAPAMPGGSLPSDQTGGQRAARPQGATTGGPTGDTSAALPRIPGGTPGTEGTFGGQRQGAARLALAKARAAGASPLACYVPGPSGEPELRRFIGLRRADGTVEVIAGIAAGETVLVPPAQMEKAKTENRGMGVSIPGLRLPGPGTGGR